MKAYDWCEYHQKEHIKKHGHSAYTNHRCRCVGCRAGMARYQNRVRRRFATLTPPDHVHGSENGYTNYSCRCDACKFAHSRARCDYRRSKRDKA